MEMGILGLPQSGKSTLFEIMTGVKSGQSHNETVVRGQASVPDERFDKLVEIYKPVKVSPAKIPFVDVHAMGEHPWESIRQNLSGTDGILHVVDGFSLPDISLSLDAYRKLEDELVLSDLLIIEKKLERLTKMSKKAISPQETAQNDLLPKLKECLEAGKPLRTAGLTSAEVFTLRSFSFWSIKPELVVVNVGEDIFFLPKLLLKKQNFQNPFWVSAVKLRRNWLDSMPLIRKNFYLRWGLPNRLLAASSAPLFLFWAACPFSLSARTKSKPG